MGGAQASPILFGGNATAIFSFAPTGRHLARRTMPSISLAPDTLDAVTARFAPAPITAPIFLNSVPKSGTHLLRNILRMFVPVDQQYTQTFIQWPNMQDHLAAFSKDRPKLSWGHLLFSDASAVETATARRVILVRDPYSWVLARARFFVSEQFKANLDFLKEGRLNIESLLNLMIFGIYGKTPSLADQYQFNAVAWLHTGTMLLRYEDLVAHVKTIDEPASQEYFARLLDHCGIAVPENWAERVQAGADRKQSSTARENLDIGGMVIPDTLPDGQKALVDVAYPGLRALLGYA